MCRRGIRGFPDEGAALVEGGQIPQWRYACRRSPRRESQCYGRGAAPRVIAAKSSEIGEGKL